MPKRKSLEDYLKKACENSSENSKDIAIGEEVKKTLQSYALTWYSRMIAIWEQHLA